MEQSIFKRIAVVVLAFLLIFIAVPATEARANSDVQVTIDGQRVLFPDQQPLLMDGRTLVPAREVF